MRESFTEKSTSQGLHVAIIMDGNGRWAAARNLPRVAGHRRGYTAVEKTIEAAARCERIETLTLYAFSSDNWKRPASEISSLMSLFRTALRQQVGRCQREGVRLTAIGRRDRLPSDLQKAIEQAEDETVHGARLQLRLAIDYSSRDALLRACATGTQPTRESIAAALGPDVDLLIRTSGEQRLSDFLLWECAYAELYFTDTPWPEFDERELQAALAVFDRRHRRFGAVATHA